MGFWARSADRLGLWAQSVIVIGAKGVMRCVRSVLPGGSCEQQNWATGHRMVQSLPTPAIRAERMIPTHIVPEACMGASMRGCESGGDQPPRRTWAYAPRALNPISCCLSPPGVLRELARASLPFLIEGLWDNRHRCVPGPSCRREASARHIGLARRHLVAADAPAGGGWHCAGRACCLKPHMTKKKLLTNAFFRLDPHDITARANGIYKRLYVANKMILRVEIEP